MTDLRKAAEMMAYEVPLHELLKSVPESARLVIDSEDGMSTSYIPVGHYCKRAAQALRQALAQPEQEPVACKHEWVRTKAMLPGDWFCFHCCEWERNTAPPKREWVGLDEKEVHWLWMDMGGRPKINGYDFAKAIEAKLKEKNT